MNKTEALKKLGWSDELLTAFEQALQTDKDIEGDFVFEFQDEEVCTSELIVSIANPTLVSGLKI